MHTTTFFAAMSAAFLAIFFLGCENVENPSWKNDGGTQSSDSGNQKNLLATQQPVAAIPQTNANRPNTSNSRQTAGNGTTIQSPASSGDPSGKQQGAGDAVSFGSLKWTYGGFNGSGARKTSASIGGLGMSSSTLSYSWTGPTLSSWGLSNDDAGACACLFVNKGDSWVGGKFDWISSSRRSRDLSNVKSGYAGWSLSGVPNPCKVAFVIVSGDGKKRTNVITGSWKR